MTQQIINTGTGPDSYTGDTIRVAFTKVNDNFSQLYAGNVGGNITANILTATSIVASGNITGSYLFGNGSQLTGVTATSNYGNSNVASYLTTYSGNVNAAYFFGNGSQLTGVTATSNYGNSNVASYLPTYSGNVNAAYFFGNGSQLTGISASLGNITVGGTTGQTLIGNVPGVFIVQPYAGNVFAIQTQYSNSGIISNVIVGTDNTNGVYIRTSKPGYTPPNLIIGSNSATIQFDGNVNTIGYGTLANPGYNHTFNGSLSGREFYADANFPTGYQFTTPLGLTGMSHAYQDDVNGNVSLVKINHDDSTPAKFYENNTTLLSGNLVVLSSNSSGSFPDAFIQAFSSANTYTQFIWQNLSNGAAATGDIVVTSDTGTDTANYIDMGMTGSGYDNTNPNNSLGTSVGYNDGYLYVKGNNDGSSGNLTIGTVDAGTVTKIIAGGVDAANVVATFSETGISVASNISFSDNYVYDGATITSPQSNGILKNFKWNFSDLSYGADTVTLQWNLLDTTFPQWYLSTSNQANIYVLDGSAGTLGFLASSINSGTVTFGAAANNGAGGSNDIELTSATGNTYMRSGSNSWAFDNTGSLHLPGNTAFLYSTANEVYLNSDSTTYNSIDIVANGDTTVRNQRAVKIVSDSDGSGHNWAFNANGNLTLPTNSSTITYANGTNILSGFTAPTQIVNGNTSVYIPTEGGDITFQRLNSNYGHIGTGLAIGYIAGNLNQGTSAVALGTGAGTENQGTHSVAIGWNVGQYDQGAGAIAIGENPGFATQGDYAIAIGTVAGRSSQGSYAIAMGVGSGYSGQTANAVAIGTRAGQYTQGQNAIAIGLLAGNSSQGGSSIAVGPSAGADTQGSNSVAVGGGAGYLAQGNGATALGAAAGEYNQGNFAVALGGGAAYSGQGIGAIAIGADASPVNQGDYSIAIGASVSGSGIQPNNSIIIDAMASSLAASGPGLFINPVRSADGANVSLSYNTSTKEITYSANTFVSNTYVPGTAGAAGTIGQISFDGNYVYICVGTNSWKRANLSTW